jgi:hypothetical protein
VADRCSIRRAAALDASIRRLVELLVATAAKSLSLCSA